MHLFVVVRKSTNEPKKNGRHKMAAFDPPRPPTVSSGGGGDGNVGDKERR